MNRGQLPNEDQWAEWALLYNVLKILCSRTEGDAQKKWVQHSVNLWHFGNVIEQCEYLRWLKNDPEFMVRYARHILLRK